MLIDRLEEECGHESIAPYLYGEITRWLECPAVDYKSRRAEPFSDLSLAIQGVSTLTEALAAYTRVRFRPCYVWPLSYSEMPLTPVPVRLYISPIQPSYSKRFRALAT